MTTYGNKPEALPWRRSSYSGGHGGNCLEIAETPGVVLVRDSKTPDAGHLTFTSRQWSEFLHGMQRGDFR